MSRRCVAGLLVVASTGLAACGATPLRVAVLDDLERLHGSADAQEGARLAPEAYARAEQERRIALEEHAAGDDLGASLHAQRAMAAYAHALVVGRLARATAEQVDAQKDLDETLAQVQTIEAERAQLDRDASAFEEQARIARDRLLPASSAATTPEREQARLMAAGSLAVEARLLCHAARLVAPNVASGSDLDGDLAKLDDRIGRRLRPPPIDDAARLRARCLDSLTRARRDAGDDASAADGLLTELSAAGSWEPSRDERGVVVTLHDPFRSGGLSPAATARLADLGRVAAAHKGFAIQVVVHDATPPRPKDETDARRADAAVAALVGGGAVASAIHAEQAGIREPLVEARDAPARARNERLDIVFVACRK